MVAQEVYEAQVVLLVRVLPYVAGEKVFALKGGTAINLFYRDLPRLSVDIDLTYLPVKDRDQSLAEINDAMDRIAMVIESGITGAKVQRIRGGGDVTTRLLVRLGNIGIKIETSPVMRGVVHIPDSLSVSEVVENAFGYVEMQVVSFEDLFAGKLLAAMDRQHPRDLYDVRMLYDNEGLTEDLFRTFLVYVACAPRPMHELLDPNLLDLGPPYAREFQGMTRIEVDLETLLDTRQRLITDIQSRLDENARRFLLSLHDGMPDFSAIGRSSVASLPAVRWKLVNLEKLKNGNSKKHAEQRQKLEALLG